MDLPQRPSSCTPLIDLHNEHLSMLCRICGSLLGEYIYPCGIYSEDLMKAFQLDVSKDTENIHPPKFCFKCCSLMKNYLKRGSSKFFSPVEWSFPAACQYKCSKA